MRNLYTLFFLITALFLSALNPYALESKDINSKQLIRINELTRDQRIIKQPNGPFAVMVFREDALANHIGIIYYKTMGNPLDGKWWISERFWQDKTWGSDVNSFYWSQDGKKLYIGTSHIYGDGGLFSLDLYGKNYIKIFPPNKDEKNNVSSTEIIEVTNSDMKIKVTYDDFEREGVINIKME